MMKKHVRPNNPTRCQQRYRRHGDVAAELMEADGIKMCWCKTCQAWHRKQIQKVIK